MNAGETALIYQVAHDGDDLGSFDGQTLRKLVLSGKIKLTDHYWHEGLTEWLTIDHLMKDSDTAPLKRKSLTIRFALGLLFCVIFAGGGILLRAKLTADRNPYPTVELGLRYLDGKGVVEDRNEAIKCFIAATEKGEKILDARAQYALGSYYYEKTQEFSNEAPITSYSNVLRAKKYLTLAAENGSIEALSVLGLLYLKDVTALVKDEAKAVEWFRIGSRKGNSTCQLLLASCLVEGTGVAKDDTEAVRWLLKAAKGGESGAYEPLGRFMYFGRGTEKNLPVAAIWLRKAAEQGDAVGQALLSRACMNGEGVPKDFVEAYKWANLAAAQDGEGLGSTVLANLSKHMTQSQIAEAQKLSREFKPRIETDR